MKKLLFICLALSFVFGCKEDMLVDNLPPDTRLFLDTIALSGDNRLNSLVKVHWSGEDQDGYVKGFELSTDEVNWEFVTRQDSTFRFDIPFGTDTVDVDFWVRAIDNKDLADPDPAYLLIPVKNTPPEVKLDSVKLIPDTVFSVFSVLWEVNDLDGIGTVDSSFIRVNDGPWVGLDASVSFVTIVPEMPGTAGRQTARVYVSSGDLLGQRLEGIEVGGMNTFIVRSRDLAGSLSEPDSSGSFLLQTQKSDLLVLDSQSNPDADQIFESVLQQVYPTYDYWDIGNNIPPFWDPTFGFILELYDKVFWYSDESVENDLGGQMLMELAANQLQTYLNEGGKVFITSAFPSTMNDVEKNGISPVFGFSPMDSLSSSSGQARIATDSMAVPRPGFAADYPPLVSSGFVLGADPFYAKDTLNVIYDAQLSAVSGWTGPTSVCARTLFTNGETNQVFFSVELHKFTKDMNALETYMDQVLNTEFNW